MAQVMDIPSEDLPYWMRQARRGWDWGLLLALLIGILAAWPFIMRPGLPRTNASENYAYLAADYASALREGRLYPRWSPNALSGYGAPIPHYFPPGAPYSAALIKVLFTNDTVRAVRIVFILGFVLAAAASYAFARRHSSAAAGLLTSALFVYSPVFASITPYIRGELSEFLALALAPALLWAVDRLLCGPRLFDYLATALVSAALLLTHPQTAVTCVALTALLFVHRRSTPSAWKAAVLAMSFSSLLAAFYWMPALLERDQVTWITRESSSISLSADALIAPLRPIDLNELIPHPQLTLGGPLLLMTFLAIGSQLIQRRLYAFQNSFLAAALVLMTAGLFVLPGEVWLLGPASLCLAIASSTVMNLRIRFPKQWHRIYAAALMTLVAVLSLPVFLVPQWSSTFGGTEPIDQVVYEQQGAGIASLPPSHPLPLSMPQMPTANRLLLSGYETSNINKIAPLQAGNRTQITLIAHETHRERFQVQSGTATPITLLTAYFPGWQANAAGRSLFVYPNEQTGLINFDIPPISGELIVTLGSTPVRQGAWLVSAASVLLLLLVWRRLRQPAAPPDDSPFLSAGEARLISPIIAALLVIVAGFTAPNAPISLYDRPGHNLANTDVLRARTNTGLELLAYKIEPAALHPGDNLSVILYWQSLRTLPGNYQIQVTLSQTDDHQAVVRSTLRSPGFYPTSRWRTYRYVQDRYAFPLPPSMTPGEYQVLVEVFDCNPDCDHTNRQTFFSISGANVGQSLALPQPVTVTS
jgi:hypothetical protein